MPVDTTYTSLRENLAAVLDRVTDDQEVVIVRRRGAKDVALIRPTNWQPDGDRPPAPLAAQCQAAEGVHSEAQTRQGQTQSSEAAARGDWSRYGGLSARRFFDHRVPPKTWIYWMNTDRKTCSPDIGTGAKPCYRDPFPGHRQTGIARSSNWPDALVATNHSRSTDSFTGFASTRIRFLRPAITTKIKFSQCG